MPIAEARAATGPGTRPDHLGDTVTVAGRAGAAPGQLSATRLLMPLQSDTAGIFLFAPRGGAFPPPDSARAFAAGDSLVATGVVDQYNGLTELRLLSYRVAGETGTPPAPVELPRVGAAAGERYESELVRLEGEVVETGRNEGGQYLFLKTPGEGQELIQLFVRDGRTGAMDPSKYQTGDRLRVTGPVGQYDYEPPYSERYQIYPRRPEDIQAVGMTGRFYERAAMVGVGVLAVLLLWAGLLRAQVSRRTRELSESKERLRRFGEVTREGVLFHRSGTILDANETMSALTGYSGEELRAIQVSDLFDEARDFEGPPGAKEEEALGRTADGTTFHAELHEEDAPYWDEEGARVLVVRDVTARKEYEAALIEAKEVSEEAVRAKSSILHNMSHELRTPLTSILGFAEVLEEESEGEQCEFAGRIAENGKRLRQTLESVLDLAQLRADGEEGELELESVNLLSFVEETARVFQRQAEEKELRFEVQTPAEPVYARLDEGALYRILSNLLSNAVKFTEEGSVAVRVSATPGEARVEVEDTGIGIGEDFQAQLFEEFKQESRGLGRTHEGSGLGLAITQQLVETMDGTIDVDSDPEGGTRVAVAFPRGAVPAPDGADAEAPAGKAGARSDAKLLVVEDNANTRALAEHMLGKRYEVRSAADAQGALGTVEEATGTFDLLLIDISLGDGEEGGVGLLRQLQERPNGGTKAAPPPAVAFTARAMEGDEERYREIGFEGYLAKPFSKDQLLKTVEETMRLDAAEK
jgi:PAS domain S-box-containing protein